MKHLKSIDYPTFSGLALKKLNLDNKLAPLELKAKEATLKEIFDMFDVDNSGTCDGAELSNLMALMCGGTLGDKIKAAFVLFDTNNNGTMAYSELSSLIGTVFNFAQRLMENQMAENPLDYEDNSEFMEAFNTHDANEISVATAKKCFEDLKVPMSGEVNY